MSNEEQRSQPVQVNLTKHEKEVIQKASSAIGLSLSAYLRLAAIEKASRAEMSKDNDGEFA